MTKVFIDGSAGTTGLRIYERLETREDLELLTLSEDKRKDPKARREALLHADIAFLCLPDAAAREAVSLCEGADTVILDASTAHRTAQRWAYGFPELSPDFYQAVRQSKRIAVPGCHASGVIALVYPLVKAGLLSPETPLTCFSLTGYSGGGKSMIADYKSAERSPLLDAPRQYALGQVHKHLPEIQKVTGLADAPVFCPVVGDFYSGMEVTVPLTAKQLCGSIEEIRNVYRSCYSGPIVTYRENPFENGFASAAALSGKDSMEIAVTGNEDRILLIARYDNLGKGASGAAVECMNLVLGLDPTTGLQI